MTPEDWHTTYTPITDTEPVRSDRQRQKAQITHDMITAIQRAHGLVGRSS